MQRDDAQLIDRYLEGDSEAVEQLDRWIKAAARSYFARLSHTWDDLLQELRLEVFRVLQERRFRGGSKLKTYVWRIVSHTCLDNIRAQRRRVMVDVDESPEILHMARQAATSKTERREIVDLALRVLEKVPEHCREIWRLIVDGYSYAEMSQRLGVSENALRVRALRCRKQAIAVRESLLATGAS